MLRNHMVHCRVHRGSSLVTILSQMNLANNKLHGYTVHQIMLNTFYYQLTHTTLKKRSVIKTF